MAERLISAIRAAYVAGHIELDELERDVELALNGQRPGRWLSQYSTEEPAGPVRWFEPKYWEGRENA